MLECAVFYSRVWRCEVVYMDVPGLGWQFCCVL